MPDKEEIDLSVTEADAKTVDVPVRPPRKRYSLAFKQQLVAEVLAGQESVSVIARRHDINANLLFKWKRLFGTESKTDQSSHLVPIQMTETAADSRLCSTPPSRIEIDLGADRRITVHGEVSREALQTALEVLTR